MKRKNKHLGLSNREFEEYRDGIIELFEKGLTLIENQDIGSPEYIYSVLSNTPIFVFNSSQIEEFINRNKNTQHRNTLFFFYKNLVMWSFQKNGFVERTDIRSGKIKIPFIITTSNKNIITHKVNEIVEMPWHDPNKKDDQLSQTGDLTAHTISFRQRRALIERARGF